MKNFRKPYLSMVMAAIFLFVSCEQYDSVDTVKANKFDYELFNKNKNNPIFDKILKEISDSKSQLKKTNTITQRNREILNILNSNMKYKLNLPDSALELTEFNSKEILDKSLKNKWMTLEDVTLTNSFLKDFKSKGIDLAISNYEDRVLKMNLNETEFSKKNLFINTVMVLKHKKPDAFYKDFETNKIVLSKSGAEDEGVLACIIATIALIGSVAGLAGCATVILCGISIVGFGVAFNNWMNKCVGQHSVL